MNTNDKLADWVMVPLSDYRALYFAYVALLESGRDRIMGLGGACDPVDVMERNDVALCRARDVIKNAAPAPAGGDAYCSACDGTGTRVLWKWKDETGAEFTGYDWPNGARNLSRVEQAPDESVEAPAGTPPRAWTEQERQDAQDAMRRIVDGEKQAPAVGGDINDEVMKSDGRCPECHQPLHIDATLHDARKALAKAYGCDESELSDDEVKAARVMLAYYAHPPATQGDSIKEILNWAVDRWNQEVANRPMVNVHRRALDDTWRQVIRRCGADDIALIGPRHDDIAAQAGGEG